SGWCYVALENLNVVILGSAHREARVGGMNGYTGVKLSNAESCVEVGPGNGSSRRGIAPNAAVVADINHAAIAGEPESVRVHVRKLRTANRVDFGKSGNGSTVYRADDRSGTGATGINHSGICRVNGKCHVVEALSGAKARVGGTIRTDEGIGKLRPGSCSSVHSPDDAQKICGPRRGIRNRGIDSCSATRTRCARGNRQSYSTETCGWSSSR